MCGIAGFQGDFDANVLPRMSRMLAHRGPDNQAFRYDAASRVGLVHTRLSIIDLSVRSNQPVWDRSGRWCIIYNGEVYNYKELRRELLEQDVSFSSEGDTEVVLNLFIHQGRDGLRKLNGIFAFAIWDKVSNELLLARDPFGVKPLYYAQIPAGIVFASELKALLCAPEVPRDLDHNALWEYLTFLWAPAPRTPLRSVRKLQPGCFLLARDGETIASGSYVSYPSFEPHTTAGPEEASAELRELLGQAVRRQLVADVPVGAFLSGGVDSSALVSLAARERPGNLQCFSIEMQDNAQDEMQEDLPFARLMAQHLQVPLEIVRVSPDIVQDLPRMLFALEEPQADPAPLGSMYIAERARERNIKVLLSGAGGDDLFAGYRRHQALLQEPLWSWIPQTGRRVLSSIAASLPKRHNAMRRVSKALAYAHLPQAQRLTSYFFWIDPKISLGLLNPFLRAQVALQRVDETLRTALLDATLHAQDPLSQMLYLEQKFFLIDHNFNYTDKTGMAAGVEIRVPFLDPDLVSFANRMPAAWKHRDGTSKWLLKNALHGIVPEPVLSRKKVGFGAPLRTWLRGPLRPWVDEMLSESVVQRRGIFDYKAIEHLVRADREYRIDASYTLFGLICTEIWARQFLDRATPTATV